jgi:predicted N-acetyltransferase YhbS
MHIPKTPWSLQLKSPQLTICTRYVRPELQADAMEPDSMNAVAKAGDSAAGTVMVTKVTRWAVVQVALEADVSVAPAKEDGQGGSDAV